MFKKAEYISITNNVIPNINGLFNPKLEAFIIYIKNKYRHKSVIVNLTKQMSNCLNTKGELKDDFMSFIIYNLYSYGIDDDSSDRVHINHTLSILCDSDNIDLNSKFLLF